jgi:hypothetical protein
MADNTPTVKVYRQRDGFEASIANTPEELNKAATKGYLPKRSVLQNNPQPVSPLADVQRDARGQEVINQYTKPDSDNLGLINKIVGTDVVAHPIEAAAMGGAMLASPFIGPNTGFLSRAALTTLGAGSADAITRKLTGKPQAPLSSLGSGLQYGALPEALMAPPAAMLKRLFTGRLGHIPGGRLPDEAPNPAQLGNAIKEWGQGYYRKLSGPTWQMLKPEIEKLAATDITEIAGGKVSLAELGGKVKEAIKRVGVPAFQAAAKEMKDEMVFQTKGIEVSTIRLKQEASEWLSSAKRLATIETPGVNQGMKPVSKLITSQINKQFEVDAAKELGAGADPAAVKQLAAEMWKIAKEPPKFGRSIAERGDRSKPYAERVIDFVHTQRQIEMQLSQLSPEVRKQVIEQLASGQAQTTPAKTNVLHTMVPPGQIMTLLEDVLKLPDEVPFMTFYEMRSNWLKHSKEPAELIGNRVSGAYSHFAGQATELMDKAVTGDPMASAAYHNFRDNWREGAGVLQDRVLNKLLTAHPEEVAKVIGKGDETTSKEVVRALVGFAEENAKLHPGPETAEAVHKGYQALQNFRDTFIQTKLKEGGGAFGLSQQLRDIGDSALNTLFADKAGKAQLTKVRTIADTLERLESLQDYRIGPLRYHLRSVSPKITGRILKDPMLYEMYLGGLRGFAKSIESPFGRDLMRYSSRISEQSAKYLAQLGRVWWLAEHQMQPLVPSHAETSFDYSSKEQK